MTPGLGALPLPVGGIDLSQEILENWIIQADQLKASQGVVTIEEWVPMPPDSEIPFRPYPAAQLPAIWVMVGTGKPEASAAATVDLSYTIRWGVVCSDGRAKENRRTHDRIREEIRYLFGSVNMWGSGMFLNQSRRSVFFEDFAFGDWKLGAGNAYLLWSENSMTCRVVCPDPIVE